MICVPKPAGAKSFLAESVAERKGLLWLLPVLSYKKLLLVPVLEVIKLGTFVDQRRLTA